MRWIDRVYGAVVVDDPEVLAIVAGPTFTRLAGIKQAGPSALAFPFKQVTRYEHSLGVYLLLGRLGANRKERIAGLLHDISHTAFSHAVDFLFSTEHQDHHEKLKPEFLHRDDLAGPLASLGYQPEDFHDDSIYPLLEQPLPRLCADRLDYFFRDSLACAVTTPAQVTRFLDHLTVVDGCSIAFDDAEVAREAAERFGVMNRDWWASPTEAFIYNEFADALRAAFDSGILDERALFGDDEAVLRQMIASDHPIIQSKLDRIVNFQPDSLQDFEAKVQPKTRWIEPPVVLPNPTTPFRID